MILCKLQLTKGEFHLNVDLKLPFKGVTALFGPSGSGKTSLLRAIAGLDQATGLIQLGNDIWQDERKKAPTYKRPLAYVFQENNLFSHLSVEENLAYALKRVEKKRQKVSFEQITEMLGIASLLSRSTQNLSGGERQRVAIARALLSSPQLLLMDEPLSALDEESRSHILSLLENLFVELHIPIIYVSHSKEEVMRLADYIILLEKGRVVANGTLNEVLTRSDLALSQSKEAGVVISTIVKNHDQNFSLSSLEFSGGEFLVPLRKLEVGASLRLRVLARDVSLCLQEPKDTSVLNIFPAEVMEIIGADKAQVTVKLDVAGSIFLSKLSRKSVQNLNLEPGKKVYAQIKAVAPL